MGDGRLKVNKLPGAMASCSVSPNVLFFPKIKNERHKSNRQCRFRSGFDSLENDLSGVWVCFQEHGCLLVRIARGLQAAQLGL